MCLSGTKFFSPGASCILYASLIMKNIVVNLLLKSSPFFPISTPLPSKSECVRQNWDEFPLGFFKEFFIIKELYIYYILKYK